MPPTTPCPVCQSTDLLPFLQRSAVPVHQNLAIRSEQAAAATVVGDLALCCCQACGFVFNAAFDLAKLDYGENYDNTQALSPAFEAHLQGLVRQLVDERGVRDCRIVEVGCGKGLFLRKLVEAHSGNTGVGFDPSYQGPDADLAGRLRFERQYYGPEAAEVAADVVVCRHVIEHVPEPMALLHSVRQALAASPRARVFFETPCVEWILRNQVVWDFFYEHCSYFSAASLTTAFELAGFAVEQVGHVFGGQYLWLEARLPEQAPPVSLRPDPLPALAAAFAAAEQGLRETWQRRLADLQRGGKVALWGAGAKGVTLANLIDPDHSRIDCLVDINPVKQGGFLPGTGHPIVAPAELADRGVAVAILLNPNYRDEIAALLATLHIQLDLVG
ncbi:MAG: methyltransferase domain-containing protein [Candidatus Sericytochromatia bacterium]|nr:methyltransferase domain-containing protein [Candidatus Sericytochromatia bacterium]